MRLYVRLKLYLNSFKKGHYHSSGYLLAILFVLIADILYLSDINNYIANKVVFYIIFT